MFMAIIYLNISFFRMKEIYFDDDIDDSLYCGLLFGLGTTHVTASASTKQSTPGSESSTSDAVDTTTDSKSKTKGDSDRSSQEKSSVMKDNANNANSNGNSTPNEDAKRSLVTSTPSKPET